MPLVSVAIKSYNHAPFVERAVRSMLDQSLRDVEVLVTDDGSTDGTPDVVDAIADERIHLVRFPANRGPVFAMNATVARARGEFVAILNSDDYALPGRLERQVALLCAHPDVGAVFSVPIQVDDAGDPTTAYGAVFDVPIAHGLSTRAQWLRMFFLLGNCLCAPTAMVRRAVLEEIGPDDTRLMLLFDLDRWVRLLERYEVRVVDEPQTAFRVRAGGANLSAAQPVTRRRSAFESFEIFKRYRAYEPALLREIFAPEIAAWAIDTSGPSGVWLALIATTGTRPWHPLFALDTLYGAAESDDDRRRLTALVARLDPFRLGE